MSAIANRSAQFPSRVFNLSSQITSQPQKCLSIHHKQSTHPNDVSPHPTPRHPRPPPLLPLHHRPHTVLNTLPRPVHPHRPTIPSPRATSAIPNPTLSHPRLNPIRSHLRHTTATLTRLHGKRRRLCRPKIHPWHRIRRDIPSALVTVATRLSHSPNPPLNPFATPAHSTGHRSGRRSGRGVSSAARLPRASGRA